MALFAVANIGGLVSPSPFFFLSLSRRSLFFPSSQRTDGLLRTASPWRHAAPDYRRVPSANDYFLAAGRPRFGLIEWSSLQRFLERSMECVHACRMTEGLLWRMQEGYSPCTEQTICVTLVAPITSRSSFYMDLHHWNLS